MQQVQLLYDGAPISQAAALLVAGFREHGPCSWPDMDSALKEVQDALQPNLGIILEAGPGTYFPVLGVGSGFFRFVRSATIPEGTMTAP